MADLLRGLVVAVSEEEVGTQTTEAVASGYGELTKTLPTTLPAMLQGATADPYDDVYTDVYGDPVAEVDTAPRRLFVDDVSMFNPSGGMLTVDGVPLAYESTDDEESTITLADTLASPVPEGAMVLVEPVQIDKTAMVLIDGNSDPVPAEVPLNWHDALSVGIRNEEDREEVRLTPAGQWSYAVFDVDGELSRDGSYIDPETLPAADGASTPPELSPEPKVYGAFGALVVAWDAVPRGVTVDVYVSEESPVATETPAASAAGGGVGLQWIRTLADGSSLNSNATYYVTLIARNSAGSALPSEEASGSPALVTASDVNITADMLIANVALVEALAAVSVHITGEATLQSLTALGKAAFRTELEMGQGSSLYLRGGTTAPVTSATVVQGWDSVNLPESEQPFRARRYGGTWHDGRFYYTTAHSATSSILSIGTDGSLTTVADHAALGGGAFAARGVTRLGSNWYVLGRDDNLGGTWRVRVFNSSWTKTGEWHAYAYTIPYEPAIGNDGTNLLLARAWGAGDIHIETHHPTTGAELSDVALPVNATTHLSSVMRGDFDYGAERTIITTRNRSGGDQVYVFGASNMRRTDGEWTLADDRVGGFGWDGSNFWHLSRESETLWKYAADTSTTRRWVTAAWNQGALETTAGPTADYIPTKRKRALFRFPPMPSGATGMSVYVGVGSTEPELAEMWRQVADHPSAEFAMPGAPVVSDAHPLEVSTYPAGAPSQILTESGHGIDSTGALHVRAIVVDEP